MAELEYSREALNTLGKFYRANVMIFVEGDYDIPFWRAVFGELSTEEFAIESVGGKMQLEKLAQRISDEDVRLIVARDSDYTKVLGLASSHERVISTHGYSIENSIYTPKIISKLALLANKKQAPEDEVIVRWIDDLAEALRELVVADIASEHFQLGIAALGGHCEPLMQGKASARPSRQKIAARRASFDKRILDEHLEAAQAMIDGTGGYNIALVRGHLLASAVLRFVSEHADGKAIHKETLYSAAITAIERQLSDASHPHTDYYKRRVSRAVRSVSRAA